MARLDYALLCNAALTHPDGKISMLGAGIDRIFGPELPIRSVLTLAFRVVWSDNDLGNHHVLRITVEHGSDAEVIANVEGAVEPNRELGAHPELPIGTVAAIPLPLDVRRAGMYRVRIVLDGEDLGGVPLIAELTLPQV